MAVRPRKVAHRLQHLGVGEGLGHVTVGARALGHSRSRSCPRAVSISTGIVDSSASLAHVLQDVEAALARQHHVENHQIGRAGAHRLHRVMAVGMGFHIPAIAAQDKADRLDDVALILDTTTVLPPVVSPSTGLPPVTAPPKAVVTIGNVAHCQKAPSKRDGSRRAGAVFERAHLTTQPTCRAPPRRGHPGSGRSSIWGRTSAGMSKLAALTSSEAASASTRASPCRSAGAARQMAAPAAGKAARARRPRPRAASESPSRACATGALAGAVADHQSHRPDHLSGSMASRRKSCGMPTPSAPMQAPAAPCP
jgi:hypothetical protein